MCTITDFPTLSNTIDFLTKALLQSEKDNARYRYRHQQDVLTINSSTDDIRALNQAAIHQAISINDLQAKIDRLEIPREYSESFGSIGRSHVTPTDVRTREGK